jgi:hypothetical protein
MNCKYQKYNVKKSKIQSQKSKVKSQNAKINMSIRNEVIASFSRKVKESPGQKSISGQKVKKAKGKKAKS